MIGIAFPTHLNMFTDPHFIEFLAGVSEQASALDYDIMLSASRKDESDAYRRFAEKGTVDLVILSNVELSEERIQLLHELNIPFIVHGRTTSCHDYPFMDIDNFNVFYEPTKMLLDLGHERVGIINGISGRVYTLDRLRGWETALKERGIKPNPDYVREGPMSRENGYNYARELLQLPNRPTALLCSSVIQAIGAYRACNELELEIGSDVSIIAHDDGVPVAVPKEMDPPLTVTRSPLRDAGRKVANMAIKRLKGADLSELQCIWQAELIFRKSAGAPQKETA